MKHAICTVPALVLTLAASGCGGAISTSLPHPARTGQIPDHVLQRSDRHAEGRGFNLRAASAGNFRYEEGALDDEVRLVRLDESAICFDVIIRHTDSATVDFSNGVEATLTADPGGESTAAQVAPRPVQARAVNASRDHVVDTGRTGTYCVEENEYGQCMAYEEQAITDVVRADEVAEIYEGGGLLCFANNQTVTPASAELELTTIGGRYAWELTDAGEGGWASSFIAMPGYEQVTATLGGGAAAPAVAAPASRAAATPSASTVR